MFGGVDFSDADGGWRQNDVKSHVFADGKGHDNSHEGWHQRITAEELATIP